MSTSQLEKQTASEKTVQVTAKTAVIDGRINVQHKIGKNSVYLELKTREDILSELQACSQRKNHKEKRDQLQRRNSLPEGQELRIMAEKSGIPKMIDFDAESEQEDVARETAKSEADNKPLDMESNRFSQEQDLSQDLPQTQGHSQSQSLLRTLLTAEVPGTADGAQGHQKCDAVTVSVGGKEIGQNKVNESLYTLDSQLLPSHQSTPHPKSTAKIQGELSPIRRSHSDSIISPQSQTLHSSQITLQKTVQSQQELTYSQLENYIEDSQPIACGQSGLGQVETVQKTVVGKKDSGNNSSQQLKNKEDSQSGIDSQGKESSYTGPSELEMMASEMGVEIKNKKPVVAAPEESAQDVEMRENEGGQEKKKKKRRRGGKSAEIMSDDTTTDASSPQQRKVRKVLKNPPEKGEGETPVTSQGGLMSEIQGLVKSFRKEQNTYRKKWDERLAKERQQLLTDVKDTIAAVVAQSVQAAVRQVQDNLSQEIKTETGKCLSAVEELNKRMDTLTNTVKEVERSANFAHEEVKTAKKQCEENKTQIDGKIDELNQNFQAYRRAKRATDDGSKKERQKLAERLNAVDRNREHDEIRLKNLEEKMMEDDFPVNKTMVVYYLVHEENRSDLEIAETFVHYVLRLPHLTVVKARRMGQLDVESKGTMKILFHSEAQLKEALQAKNILGEYEGEEGGDDIRGVWVRQSKTKAQLMLENHTRVLIRAMHLENQVRIMPNGRLMRLRGNNFRGASGRGGRGGRSYRESAHEAENPTAEYQQQQYPRTEYQPREDDWYRGHQKSRGRGRGRPARYQSGSNRRGGPRIRGNGRGGTGSEFRPAEAGYLSSTRGEYEYDHDNAEPFSRANRDSYTGRSTYQTGGRAGRERARRGNRGNRSTVRGTGRNNFTRDQDSAKADVTRRESERSQEDEVFTNSLQEEENGQNRENSLSGTFLTTHSSVASSAGVQQEQGKDPVEMMEVQTSGGENTLVKVPVTASVTSSVKVVTGEMQRHRQMQQSTVAADATVVQNAASGNNEQGVNKVVNRTSTAEEHFPALGNTDSGSDKVNRCTDTKVLKMFAARRNPHYQHRYQQNRRQSDEQSAQQSARREYRSGMTSNNKRGGSSKNQARVFPEDERVAQQMERQKNGMLRNVSELAKGICVADSGVHGSQVPHCSKQVQGEETGYNQE